MHDITYHHALKWRNGARDPVNRVLLQKVANRLRSSVRLEDCVWTRLTRGRATGATLPSRETESDSSFACRLDCRP